MPGTARLGKAALRQIHVRPAGEAVLHVPGALAVAEQHDFGHELLRLSYGLSLSAATPGSTRPSRYSSDAPPPVDTCVICVATPAFLTALALSPPPMTVVAPVVANSLAMANVPSANLGNSNTPIGPFHTTNLARLSTSPNCAMRFVPMSSS